MSTEHRTADNQWGLEPLLDVGELATYLGVPVSTIYDWRSRGLGPRADRFGKHLKFDVSDVRVWVEQQRDSSSARADASSPVPDIATARTGSCRPPAIPASRRNGH